MRFEGTGWQHDADAGWTPLHGHVFIFDLCGFIFVHTTRECAADAEPGSGSQALDGSRGLR